MKKRFIKFINIIFYVTLGIIIFMVLTTSNFNSNKIINKVSQESREFISTIYAKSISFNSEYNFVSIENLNKNLNDYNGKKILTNGYIIDLIQAPDGTNLLRDSNGYHITIKNCFGKNRVYDWGVLYKANGNLTGGVLVCDIPLD